MHLGHSAGVVQRVGVPVELHLVVDSRGWPEQEQLDHGAAVHWVCSDPTGRPADFGAGTQRISGDTLRRREATGSARFLIETNDRDSSTEWMHSEASPFYTDH